MFNQENDFFSQNHNNSPSDVTLIHMAAQANDLEMLNAALQQNIDINAVTKDGWSALHFAAYKGHRDIVKALLEAGIDAAIQGNLYGRTALHYAANQGHIAVVKLLIDYAPMLKSIKDNGNKTAFDIAKEKGFADIVELMMHN